MPITKIVKRVEKKEARPNVVIDVAAFLPEGDEETKVTFREPRSKDMFASGARRNRLKLKRPGFSDHLIMQILLLASCYVPAPNEEKGVNLDDVMLTIADNDRDMFLFILSKFSEAYPMVTGISEEDAGNASPQTNDDSSSSASTD